MELIAHRGESADAPENTLAAFRLAWDRQVSAIELDVHLTRDGEAIVCHDPDTQRTTGTLRMIKDTPLSDLRALDAGTWKGPAWAGEKLPTLAEVLATIPNHGRCYIEIKVGQEAVPAVAEAIRASGKRSEQLAIMSFNASTVAAARRRLPDVPAYFLAEFEQDQATGDWAPTADVLIAQARAVRADGLHVSHEGPLDRAFVRTVKAAGLALYVWTVDDAIVARRIVELGVDGITTNKAAWMKEQLKKA